MTSYRYPVGETNGREDGIRGEGRADDFPRDVPSRQIISTFRQ